MEGVPDLDHISVVNMVLGRGGVLGQGKVAVHW